MHTFAFLHVGAAGGLSATQVRPPGPSAPQGQPSGAGPAPHVHFPGGRLCREALKSGHRAASDPVVRDTAEGLGPEGLPSGIGPAALCRRPTADHALYFCPAPSWAHPYKGRRISGFVQAIFGGFLSISPRSQKTSAFLGGAHSGQHPRHHLHHPHPWRTLMRMMPVMRGMLGMLSPKSGQLCRKRAT